MVAGNTNALLRAATSQGRYGLNKVKASVFRRWPVTEAYSLRANRLFDGQS